MRAFLRRIGKALRSWSVILTLLVLILALLIWFVGPMLGAGDIYPLASVSVRLACLLVLTLVWAMIGFFLRIRRSSEENALLAALKKQRDEQESSTKKAEDLLEAEFASFRESTRQVLAFLRRTTPGILSSGRYELPWYIILGHDGAGKTSLVRDSGLQPVVAEEDDGSDLPLPPARFRITEEAVFIEFAGGVLTMDEKMVERRLHRLLDHIRHVRPRQPINGILVATGMDALQTADIQDFTEKGANLRRRIDYVMTRLGTQAPVYLAVTKFDLVVGFEEFFEALNIEERAAPFGFAIADGEMGEDAAEAFDRRFAELVDSLSQEQFARLDEEPDELRRRRLTEFPSQCAVIGPKLSAFVRALASAQRLGRAPVLRGLFFTSTEQSAEFRDGLVNRMAPRFAEKDASLSFSRDISFDRRYAFFLHGLFRKVLLPEAHLSGLTRPARAILKGRDVAANVALAALACVLIALLWFSFLDGRDYAKRVSAAADRAQEQIASAAPNGTVANRFEPVLATLDELRALTAEGSSALRFGMYGTGATEEAARQAYDKAIANLLFPYLWGYIKEGLSAQSTPAALRFRQLKLYLMLTGSRPVDQAAAAAIAPDFAARWLGDNPGGNVEARVTAHLAELARASLATPPQNAPLVETARRLISNYTLARIGYDMALAEPDARALPLWRPVDHMSLSGPEAIGRASGTSLWEGIKGVYTRPGLRNVMQPAARTMAERIAADLWIMGNSAGFAGLDRESMRIRDGILDLYRVDYIREWDTLLADLGTAAVFTPDEVARAVATLTGSPSPIRELFMAIAAETNPDVDNSLTGQLTTAVGARVQQATPAALAPRRMVNVAKAISDHFRPFREAVTAPEGKPAPVDGIITALVPLYTKLNFIATGGDVLELGTEPQTLLTAVSDKVRDMPAVLQPFFTRLTDRITEVLTGSSWDRLKDIWASRVLPACRAATDGRYPFDPNSQSDASLQDFAAVFGPKGAITSFRTSYLKPFIDTTTKPWRWRKGPLDRPGARVNILQALQNAGDITDVYFGESEMPKVQFTIKPAQLDSAARALQFDIGNSTLSYAHGPATENVYQWPPDPIASPVAISVTPEIAGKRNTISRQGNWALFRLFDTARVLEKDPADIVSLRFDIGGRSAILQVTAPVTRNPFAHDALANFKCPVL